MKHNKLKKLGLFSLIFCPFMYSVSLGQLPYTIHNSVAPGHDEILIDIDYDGDYDYKCINKYNPLTNYNLVQKLNNYVPKKTIIDEDNFKICTFKETIKVESKESLKFKIINTEGKLIKTVSTNTEVELHDGTYIFVFPDRTINFIKGEKI